MKTHRSFLLPSLSITVFSLLVILLPPLAGPRLLGDGDTGYHIRAGEIMLEQGKIIHEDPFSYTRGGQPWTTHEWLSEILMAFLHRAGGLTGVVFFFALLLAIFQALIFRKIYASSNVLATILVFGLAFPCSMVHWLARPHVFSLLFILLSINVLDAFQAGRRKLLFLLVPLMVLWVNLHGGFIFGLVLIGIYLVGNMIDLQWDKVRTLALLFGLCLAASLLNPHGYSILFFPFRFIGDPFLMNTIQEFMSPDFHKWPFFAYFLLLSIAVFTLARPSLTTIELLLVLFAFKAGLSSVRNMPLCAALVAPILARQLTQLLKGWGQGFSERIREQDRNAKGSFWAVIAIAGMVTMIATGKFSVTPKGAPLAALEFLSQEKILGRMFNHDEFGDYLIYKLWPQYQVFIDGRSDMYGKEMLKDYLAVVKLKPNWRDVFDKYQVDWVFFSTGSPISVMLRSQPDWARIYQDKTAEIFVKRNATYQALIEKYEI